MVVIDDADNIGPAILAAVKKIATRTDVHLLLAARDAEWHVKRLVPGIWQPAANFHTEPLAGLDREDAGRIVAGWVAWGNEAMGKLKSRSEAAAINELLAHARDFATRQEAGELLGALLVTRQGEDMHAHVRTLVNGLGRNPVIKTYSLRDIYAAVAAMHAENELYLSRSVLAFALGCDIDELERRALLPLRREAMPDSGDTYVLTRHRRIAEAACAVMREDEDDVYRWYPLLARAAIQAFVRKAFVVTDIRQSGPLPLPAISRKRENAGGLSPVTSPRRFTRQSPQTRKALLRLPPSSAAQGERRMQWRCSKPPASASPTIAMCWLHGALSPVWRAPMG